MSTESSRFVGEVVYSTPMIYLYHGVPEIYDPNYGSDRKADVYEEVCALVTSLIWNEEDGEENHS